MQLTSHKANFFDLQWSYKSIRNNNLIEKLETNMSVKLTEKELELEKRSNLTYNKRNAN